MKILFFLSTILFINSFGLPTKNQNIFPFIIRNKECLYTVEQRKFGCDDIDNILERQRDKNEYIKYICDRAFYGYFTNNQFTQHINYKLYNNGIYNCNISIAHKLDNVLVKEQCQEEYDRYCTSNSNFYAFSEWLF